jgi:hypothetical protein
MEAPITDQQIKLPYIVPDDIFNYLLGAGFMPRSQTLLIKAQNDFKQYLLYITKEGMYSLILRMAAPNETPFKKSLFAGYIVKDLEQIKFLINENAFFS